MHASKDEGSRKNILMIAANPAVSPLTGWPIGFWWSELTHPYWAFREIGYAVDFASPEGGAIVADGFSDPEDPSGYSAHDIISLGFKKSPAHSALLSDTRPLAAVDLGAYHAIFIAGGQSPMFTMIDNKQICDFVVNAYEGGTVVAVVCHATCVLLKARLSNGDLLVKGKTWTGFANAEEAFAEGFVGKRIQPFWIEEEARKIAGTNFIVDGAFRPFAVRDGHLITGQQQNSGAAAAALVIEALGR